MSVQSVESAVARVARNDGTTLGTGFFVSQRGGLLTCDPVLPAAGLEALTIETSNGYLSQTLRPLKAHDFGQGISIRRDQRFRSIPSSW